jgi:hypothetical protein
MSDQNFVDRVKQRWETDPDFRAEWQAYLDANARAVERYREKPFVELTHAEQRAVARARLALRQRRPPD